MSAGKLVDVIASWPAGRGALTAEHRQDLAVWLVDQGVQVEPELDFTRLEREIRDAPDTWIPALLKAALEAAHSKNVFAGRDELLGFVKAVLAIAGR